MRLDSWLCKQFPEYSRTFIARAIQNGCVQINGKVCTKPGTIIAEADVVEAQLSKKYVGFAGFKLAHALSFFSINVTGLVCLDAGLSTGGFADCLLQNGAQKVYGVDVGTAQIDSVLAQDERLVVLEQTNLKTIVRLPDQIDFCSLDLSFTSVIPFISVVSGLLRQFNAGIVILIKPQFEVGAEFLTASGIVRNEKEQQRACTIVCQTLKDAGFLVRGVTEAPRKEENGNQEFLVYAVR